MLLICKCMYVDSSYMKKNHTHEYTCIYVVLSLIIYVLSRVNIFITVLIIRSVNVCKFKVAEP